MDASASSQIDPISRAPSHWAISGPSWKGFSEIRYLFIFGDSYSQTFGRQPRFVSRAREDSTDESSSNDPTGQPTPTDELPLGVPWPGDTYRGEANWVGYLVYEETKKQLLVYNFAKNGVTIKRVKAQVSSEFFSRSSSIPWTPENSLFVTWVGINDLASISDPAPALRQLFGLQDQLYEHGARNFCYIDVPPMYRSPAYDTPMLHSRETRFVAWNETITKCIRDFTAKHSLQEPASPLSTQDSGAPTCLYFSSHRVFSEILDNPVAAGYPSKDVKKAGGSIWMDRLHATAAVHKDVARELAEFLRSVEGVSSSA